MVIISPDTSCSASVASVGDNLIANRSISVFNQGEGGVIKSDDFISIGLWLIDRCKYYDENEEEEKPQSEKHK